MVERKSLYGMLSLLVKQIGLPEVGFLSVTVSSLMLSCVHAVIISKETNDSKMENNMVFGDMEL